MTDIRTDRQLFSKGYILLGTLVYVQFAVSEVEEAPLQLVQVYFDTDTYDRIERDVKVTFEAMFGLIGGTMGFLTGFSLLSGVEIVYFACKLIFTLTTRKRSRLS